MWLKKKATWRKRVWLVGESLASAVLAPNPLFSLLLFVWVPAARDKLDAWAKHSANPLSRYAPWLVAESGQWRCGVKDCVFKHRWLDGQKTSRRDDSRENKLNANQSDEDFCTYRCLIRGVLSEKHVVESCSEGFFFFFWSFETGFRTNI